MASLRTEVTEIVTGLAMLGYADLDRALATRPAAVHNVTDEHFDRLDAARAAGTLDTEFTVAWNNGLHFARADDALRGRPPKLLEWKGSHRPPGYEQIPADLRIDHVYLVSCKYGSDILLNASPGHLFDNLLIERPEGRPLDWYHEIAPVEYQELYARSRTYLGIERDTPPEVHKLTAAHRTLLKKGLRGAWPDELAGEYEWFSTVVSHQSSERWRRRMRGRARREAMLWRLLRLQAAPYFVLGVATDGQPLAFRVGTPWDFRAAFNLKRFDMWPDSVGQPVVRWRAEVTAKGSRVDHIIEGHVEIRWSHGRFGGVPEAKVYLDTPHHEVAGYYPLT